MRLALLFLIITSSWSWSQDLQFTQQHQTQFANPAITSLNYGKSLNTQHRIQWASQQTSMLSNLITYEDWLGRIGGFGVYYLNDFATKGYFSDNQLGLSYGYSFNLTRKHTLALGITSVFGHREYHSTYENPFLINPRSNNTYYSEAPELEGYYLDFKAGMLFYGKNFYLDVGVAHFMGIKEAEDINVTANIGWTIPIGGKESHAHYIMPSINYVNQGNYNSIAANISYSKSGLLAGFKFGYKESIGGALGMRLAKFRLVYSFEYLQNIKTQNPGYSGFVHELSFRLHMRKEKGKGGTRRGFYHTIY